MSYQVIARKWRPQTFEEVTGQETITQTLRNAVEHDRLHHAYLFSGARGVGKTTTARLLAKALNCHSADKPVLKPCNNCASCREIAEGRSIDVLEFDAASNTQVDKIRDLIIENINIAPARDRYKIFIIDEVHMLSTSSFNALLKTLEEPPPNVVFIMATTELHKVPDTILSRCQEFEFRTISTAKIFERLNIIAEAEGVTITAEALREIARSGEGSMRDAQSNFDQVISFSGEKIGIEEVISSLGIASAEILVKTIEAIAHHQPKEILLVVEELIRRGQDLRNFCRDLMAFLRDLLVAKMGEQGAGLLDSAALDIESLIKHSEHFSESDLIRLFNSLAETETRLKNAAHPRFLLEIGLGKLAEMRRLNAIENIIERLGKLENLLNGEDKGGAETEKKFEGLPEKKTLNDKVNSNKTPLAAQTPTERNLPPTDFPLNEVPFPVSSRDSVTSLKSQQEKAGKDSFTPPAIEEKKINFFDDIPLRLPEISAEDLEHFEDSKLDSAYEEKLLRENDDLLPIKNASLMIANLLKTDTESKTSVNGILPKEKTKSTINFQMPSFETAAESSKPLTLSENPTENELWEYAENNEAVKRIVRIFRGKITRVVKD